jgi:hypothetical protein
MVVEESAPVRSRRLLGALLVATLIGTGGPSFAAGTNLPDADGDGLPDAWERHGVTLDGGAGPRFIDLPAMDADPLRPDVYLQVDWMADDEHDQRPSPEAIAMVVDAFARAPYASPTGATGIALHVDAGPESPLGPGRTWGELSRARVLPWRDQLGTAASGTYDWSAFQRLKDEPDGFARSGRGAVFHYAIFAHYHDRDDARGSGASGIARGIGGTDLLVTLGNFTAAVGTPREQAASLMHELGHNLGLRHGGCDDQNFKPGYASVMNYAHQMAGITRGGVEGVLDYSRGPEPELDATLARPRATLAKLPEHGAAPVCVAEGETRAGSAVPTVVPVEVPAGDPEACDGGRPFDDWAYVRLAVGAIGRRPR